MRKIRLERSNQQNEESINALWQKGLIACIVIGLAGGLVGSFLPQSMFYETALYYGGIDWKQGLTFCNVSSMWIFLEKNIHYFAYFLIRRVLIPSVILMIGVFWNNLFFLKGFLILQLFGISFQSVLIFGALGMEGWFLNQFLMVIPESLYFLAIFRMYWFKKIKVPAIKPCFFSMLQTLFLLFMGCGMEICILCYRFSRV